MAIGNDLINLLSEAKAMGMDVRISESDDSELSVTIDYKGVTDSFIVDSIDQLIRHLSFAIWDYS